MPLYLCFIDYSKTLMILTKMGFPQHLTDLISKPIICCQNKSWKHRLFPYIKGHPAELYSVTRSFQCDEFERGVDFGCENHRFENHKRYHSSRNELMDILCRVNFLNTKKTKKIAINMRNDGEDFLLDGKVIEQVSEF